MVGKGRVSVVTLAAYVRGGEREGEAKHPLAIFFAKLFCST